MKDIVVLYHNNCADGFSGAWVARKKFKDEASYVGVDHNGQMPIGLEKKKIYFIDFSYKPEVMRRLLVANESVFVIEHHVSQKDSVSISTDYVYDAAHSGSVLAWKFFFPDRKVPRLLEYVEDRDLWNWKLPNSKELTASLEIRDFDFKVWGRLANDFENKDKRKRYIDEGKIILKYNETIVDMLMIHAEKVDLDGEDVYVINSPILANEIGERIVRDKKGAGLIWHYRKNKLIASLRANGKTDVAEIAKKFGGGGHKSSSGFTAEMSIEFPWDK